MIVLDASAVVQLLAGGGDWDWVSERVLEHAGELCAPHLLDAEVLSAIRGLVLGARARRSEAEAMLADFLDLKLTRYPHGPLFASAWSLRKAITAYDALYVGLAQALDVPMVTTDRALARAARRHVRVLVPAR
ncbi:MAG: type II toxin-antitoxin system VapC family toxin [Actinomycetota bacterium]